VVKAHFIVAKTNGLLAHDSRFSQLCGLSRSYLLNRLGRHKLAKQYHRYVFTHPTQSIVIDDPHSLPTHYVDLSVGNLKKALYASGAIPLVMDGVNDFENLPVEHIEMVASSTITLILRLKQNQSRGR
jgi:hypothetical protein